MPPTLPKLLSCDEHDLIQFPSGDRSPLGERNSSLDIQSNTSSPTQNHIAGIHFEQNGSLLPVNISHHQHHGNQHNVHDTANVYDQNSQNHMHSTFACLSVPQTSSEDFSFRDSNIASNIFSDTESTDTAASKNVENTTSLDNEVQDLIADQRRQSATSMLESMTSNEMEAQKVAAEDVWSSLFHNEMDCTMDYSRDSHLQQTDLENESLTNAAVTRGQLGEGLKQWNYCSPFETFEIDVDGINHELGKRYVEETNAVLENVTKGIRDINSTFHTIGHSNLCRMDTFDVFLPNYVLTKLATNINRVLKSRRQQLTDPFEFKGVIILHVLASSYRTSVNTMALPENKDFFFDIGITGKRYLEIWSALCCTTQRRQRVEVMGSCWENVPRRANALITELEDELAAINRFLLLIPGQTILSLDDDHQRLRSRAVAQLTLMSHINNPKKALGPVNNAICSALNPVFLAGHYTRAGDKSIDVWQRLIRLLQGVPTARPIRGMCEYIFAADRGYSNQDATNFLNQLGATILGTHKRSLDYPFSFGDGAIRKRHKGVEKKKKDVAQYMQLVGSPQQRLDGL